MRKYSKYLVRVKINHKELSKKTWVMFWQEKQEQAVPHEHHWCASAMV